jgi:hypothetical protein
MKERYVDGGEVNETGGEVSCSRPMIGRWASTGAQVLHSCWVNVPPVYSIKFGIFCGGGICLFAARCLHSHYLVANSTSTCTCAALSMFIDLVPSEPALSSHEKRLRTCML